MPRNWKVRKHNNFPLRKIADSIAIIVIMITAIAMVIYIKPIKHKKEKR